MKRLILLTTYLFIGFMAFAQDSTMQKGFVGFNIGASLPNGEFSDNDPESEKAGLAMTGMFYEFNFGYRFAPPMGVMLAVRQQMHNVDTDVVEDYLEEGYSFYSTTNVRSDKWKSTNLMGGIYFSFPFTGNKVSLELKGLMGAAFTTSPELDVYYYESDFNGDYFEVETKQEEGGSTTLCFNIGGGLKIAASESISITLNVDYYNTDADFDDIRTYNTLNSSFMQSSSYRDETSFKQSIQTINLGVGLAYTF